MGSLVQVKPSFAYQEAKTTFLVGDIQDATDFYCDVLGFKKNWSWGNPETKVGVGPASLAGNQLFEIALISDPKIGPSGTGFVYVFVTGIEALYERCLYHDAEIHLALGARDWGVRDFRVADPFGNRIGFGEKL